jgi:hypothetical protein
LATFLLLSICDIITTGRWLTVISNKTTLSIFTSIQLGLIVAFFWMLFLSSVVNFRIVNDGTPLSILLVLGSAILLFIPTLYISLDTAFDITGHFNQDRAKLQNLALYILYLGSPLICAFGYSVCQGIVVINVLGETRPLCKSEYPLLV